jgi:hypothetical protein
MAMLHLHSEAIVLSSKSSVNSDSFKDEDDKCSVGDE